jgi:hypothetical protein
VEELIRVLLQQAGRAEEPDSCRGDVIGWQLERPEHSAAIEERPSHVADALDSNAISESTEMSRRSLIERAHKVTPFVRNRETGSGIPDHLEELLLLRLRVLRNSREGLLDPLRNRSQVGFGHGFEEGGAVIDQQAEVFTG